MGDPWAAVKLSEFFSDCYAEQHENYHTNLDSNAQSNVCLYILALFGITATLERVFHSRAGIIRQPLYSPSFWL